MQRHFHYTTVCDTDQQESRMDLSARPPDEEIQLWLPFDAIQDFEQRLPYRTACSNTKRIKYILPKDKAREYPYIQVNYPNIDYICFDLDYPGAPIAAQEKDLPFPTLTVISPDTHRAHLLYELINPIPRKLNAKTKSLLKDVLFVYKELLCADKVITTQKQLVKNALCPKWDVIRGHKPFTLSELAESKPPGLNIDRTFDLPTETFVGAKPFEETLCPSSRNCSLFHNARFYAYSVVREHSTYESLYESVLNRIIHLNNTEVPRYFPAKIKQTSELKSIARSIARWTFERRNQFKAVNKGAMGFDSMRGVYWEPDEFNKEVKRRRQLSAKRTHEIRKQSTEEKIRFAVALCIRRGFEPTQMNIATFAQVSRMTIYRYRDVVKESVTNGLSGRYT